ncbi:MAG: class C beta-lactamase-related serine hydrolase [Comamonadaceae bacterium]|nr:MAG: class C beta-lactamase-related serine hydrolase [Comamonadaceae bacterium]
MNRRCRAAVTAGATALAMSLVGAPAHAQLRVATPQEAALDAAAFERVDQVLAETLTDVQSVVVAVGGRIAYSYHRDGAPERLRDQQSAEKSALSALVGIAIAQGHIAGLDQPVLALVPEWAARNADPRLAAMTLRHLLTLTAGFAVDDLRGPPRRMTAADAWARPLAHTPGERFAYDNAAVTLLVAVLERATGMPLADFARRQLLKPLAMAEPEYAGTLRLRTIDMAKLGELFLRKGRWDGQQLVPADYVAAATQAQAGGGPPVGMPYGLMWWIVPPAGAGNFMASGWGGQMVWVHPGLDVVVAANSSVTPASQQRGHAVRLLHSGLLAAVHARGGRN